MNFIGPLAYFAFGLWIALTVGVVALWILMHGLPKQARKEPAASRRAKQAATPKPAPWHYTEFRNERFRYREVGKDFVVERSKDGKWVEAPVTAARAIHEKSESICSLAARILPTCSGRGRARQVRPTAAEKQAMRKFLGL